MAEDKRDFLEKTESINQDLNGGDPVPLEKIEEGFALYGPEKRVAWLDKIKGETSGDNSSIGLHEIRRVLRKQGHVNRLQELHNRLCKVKR